MNIAPITEKGVAKVQQIAERNSEAICGYLRRDALNAVQQAKEIVSKPNEYLSPFALIETPAAPKDCAQFIDFRF